MDYAPNAQLADFAHILEQKRLVTALENAPPSSTGRPG